MRSYSPIKTKANGVAEMEKLSDKELMENVDKTLVSEVLSAIKGIDYGQVLITIHDSRIVQIERTEKIRIRRPRECICK